MIRKRAISDSQKQERRNAILHTAAACFETSSFNDISMDDIAARAGIAKGTLYLYFKTKEELFLSLYAQTLQHWFDEIDEALSATTATADHCTADEFTRMVSDSMHRYPLLVRLMSITHSILERNIDAQAALEFKLMLQKSMIYTGGLTEACLPFLQPGQGAHLLLQLYALVIGIQSMAEPATVVRPMLEKPELRIFKIDFTEELLSSLSSLLLGIEEQNRRKQSDE